MSSSNYSPSSDSRSVNIYITNSTNQKFSHVQYEGDNSNAGVYLNHGKIVNQPYSTIDANSAETLIATFGSKSTYGPQGLLTYKSDDGTILNIYFNNPEPGEITSSTCEINQSFYGMLVPAEANNGTNYYLEITGFTMSISGSESDAPMYPVIAINTNAG